ncbi:MAG: hypothetical protein NZ937_08665, partial [Armatimonadetes bacterium]|nr:hypothetical protein [Armatimonadota bacterium]
MRLRIVGLVVVWVLSANFAFASLPSVLEAEQAELSKGAVIVRHPKASGGAFVEAQSVTNLRFAIHA